MLIVIFHFLFGLSEVNSQSIFDKFEKFLVSKKIQISYGIQSGWYKESTIHFVQNRYNRDILIHDVNATDKNNFQFLLDGQFSVNQFKINVEINLSDNYSFLFLTSHLGYHVDINREYYKIGLWNDERISNSKNLSEFFQDLEHSNGINPINLGIRRRINFSKNKTINSNLEFGILPNIGILYTATQAKIINPNNEIEVYNLGNKLAGYNYGIEVDFRFYIKSHWMIGFNFNYFHMRVRKARLEKKAYVNQNIIGSNFGINFGYRI